MGKKNRQNLRTEEVQEFIRKSGIPLTIETNPSPERLAEIDRYFKRRAALEVLFKSKLNKSED